MLKEETLLVIYIYLQSCFTPTISLCFREEGANIYCGLTKLNSVPENLQMVSHIILTYGPLRYVIPILQMWKLRLRD